MIYLACTVVMAPYCVQRQGISYLARQPGEGMDTERCKYWKRQVAATVSGSLRAVIAVT